ncbi:hypothetical protein P3S38_28710, partial [Enterobacter hormaechei]|nr:hypothetical protein [Enterobacter hormaechei]
LESQKVLDEYYLELHNYFGYFYVEFHKYYMELQRDYLELQKVLNKNKYYLEFIYFLKTLSRNLNNVTQDAINQHSSSWIMCQKECLDRSIRKKQNNRFSILIQNVDYHFIKDLKYLVCGSIAKEGRLTTLRLPSGEVRLISENCSATIGQVGNVKWKNRTLSKAGSKRWLGKRPEVRGIVMNAVDRSWCLILSCFEYYSMLYNFKRRLMQS